MDICKITNRKLLTTTVAFFALVAASILFTVLSFIHINNVVGIVGIVLSIVFFLMWVAHIWAVMIKFIMASDEIDY